MFRFSTDQDQLWQQWPAPAIVTHEQKQWGADARAQHELVGLQLPGQWADERPTSAPPRPQQLRLLRQLDLHALQQWHERWIPRLTSSS